MLIASIPAIILFLVMLAGFGYRHWKLNQAPLKVPSSRINRATFTQYEREQSREWM